MPDVAIVLKDNQDACVIVSEDRSCGVKNKYLTLGPACQYM